MDTRTVTAIVAITFMAIAGYFLTRKKPTGEVLGAEMPPGTSIFEEEELEEEPVLLEEEVPTLFLPTEEELAALDISGERVVEVIELSPLIDRETGELDDGIICRTDSGAKVAVSTTSGSTSRIVGSSPSGTITTSRPKPTGRFGVAS